MLTTLRHRLVAAMSAVSNTINSWFLAERCDVKNTSYHRHTLKSVNLLPVFVRSVFDRGLFLGYRWFDYVFLVGIVLSTIVGSMLLTVLSGLDVPEVMLVKFIGFCLVVSVIWIGLYLSLFVLSVLYLLFDYRSRSGSDQKETVISLLDCYSDGSDVVVVRKPYPYRRRYQTWMSYNDLLSDEPLENFQRGLVNVKINRLSHRRLRRTL